MSKLSVINGAYGSQGFSLDRFLHPDSRESEGQVLQEIDAGYEGALTTLPLFSLRRHVRGDLANQVGPALDRMAELLPSDAIATLGPASPDCYRDPVGFDAACTIHRAQLLRVLQSFPQAAVIIETVPGSEDARAAWHLAKVLKMDRRFTTNFVVGPDGKLPSGESTEGAIKSIQDWLGEPADFGLNCHGFGQTRQLIDSLDRAGVLSAVSTYYPNAADAWGADFEGASSSVNALDESSLKSYVDFLEKAGASRLSLCCGSSFQNITQLKRLIEESSQAAA